MKNYFCLEAIEFQCNFVLRPSKVRKLVRTNQFQVKSTKMGTGRKFVTLQYGFVFSQVTEATRCMVNVWVPLVKATTDNGCMQFIPCSHKLGIQKHVDTKEYLQLAPEAVEPLQQQAVNVEVNPGDVVLFGQLLFHCGLPNSSDHVRWSFDFRYQDATAPTLRREKGHMARSQVAPDQVVRDGEHWSQLELGGPNPR